MANKKISELSSSLAPPLSGVTAVVHDGTTYQSTLGTLRQLLVDSGSHAFTGSQTINGNLIVSGSLTAQEYILSSSITNITTETISGSSRFGNSSDDVHSFTGSLRIDGRIDRLLVGTGSYLTGVDDDPEILHVQNSESYNIAHFQADNPFYAQINIKNTNSGSFASTDLVLTADNGTEIIHHVNLGINSSTYNGGAVGYNNDSYLINAGKDMYVGTLGGSQHPAKVKLFTMGNWQTPHITLHTGTTISFNTGSVSDGFEYEFSGSVKLKNELSVNGSVTASYFIGDGSQLTNLPTQSVDVSMFLSSSTFTSASASFATTGSNIFSGNQIVTGSFDVTSFLNVGTGNGDEGGEMMLVKPITNTNISGSGVIIDSYRDRIRIFEQGGATRGAFLDITKQSNAVSSQIVTSPNLFSIQTITSASYATLTPVSGTLYIIID
jgi:hypothetical protein